MGYNMKRGNTPVPFKELGSSPLTQKTDHPKKEVPPEHKDLDVTAGESSRLDAKTNDIEDRIEFLNSDLEETTNVMARGKIITKLTKLKSRLKKLQ